MNEPKAVREEVLIDKHRKKIITRYFKDPDGKERDFLLWGGKVVPTIIFPITTDKKVIALRMFRRAANESIIEIPGGNPGAEESPLDCALREIEEETGWIPKHMIRLGPDIWFDPASCIIPYTPFVALDCKKKQEQELDKTEVAEGMEMNLIELKEWFKMIYRGEIRDSKTIAITFLALPHLGIKI